MTLCLGWRNLLLLQGWLSCVAAIKEANPGVMLVLCRVNFVYWSVGEGSLRRLEKVLRAAVLRPLLGIILSTLSCLCLSRFEFYRITHSGR